MQQSISPASTFGNIDPPNLEELLITNEDGSQFISKLSQSIITVGRGNDNDIVLNSQSVSRHHTRLEWQQGKWYIIDLGSTNGVLYQGQRVLTGKPQPWSLNETVKIGRYVLQLRRSQVEIQDRTQFIRPEDIDPSVHKLRSAYAAKSDLRYTFNMWPGNVRHGERVCIAVQNEGNTASNFTVRMATNDALKFSTEVWNAHIPAGLEKRVHVGIIAAKRPLLGPAKLMPFEAMLESEDGNHRNVSGTLEVKPILTRAKMYAATGLAGLTGLAYLISTFLLG